MELKNKKTLGVIGGLGPIATSHFMELIIKMTDANIDQDHINMIIYSRPDIPDRTEYILDNQKPNPLPDIIKVGQILDSQDVDFIAVPCITAHYFYEVLEKEINTPIINIVTETADYLYKNQVKRVGIMATDGTVSTGLFQKALSEKGLEAVLPSAKNQKNVMSLIYDCVKADKPVDMAVFNEVKEELVSSGCESIILGCTELSLIKRDYNIGSGFIDAMEVLAQQSILKCGACVKEKYKDLITK